MTGESETPPPTPVAIVGSFFYLIAGFGIAARRPHYVLLDMIAKGVFLFVAVIVLWASGLLFLARVPLTDADLVAMQSGIPPVAFLTLVQAIIENRGLLGRSLLMALLACFLLWTGIEAFVHGVLLPPSGGTRIRDAFLYFPRYFLTGTIRRSLLATAGIVVGVVALGPLLANPVGEWSRRWPDVQWPVLAGTILIAVLALFLTILDTLTRCAALDLLGPSLPVVALVIGFPAAVEASIWGLAAAVLALAGPAGLPPGAILILGGVLAVALSAAHSFLLLARYSAIDIMRQHS